MANRLGASLGHDCIGQGCMHGMTASPFVNRAQQLLDTVTSAFASVPPLEFTHSPSGEPSAAIDPMFTAKAPMSNRNIDVHTLNELGKMGLKRGKEITATTHPEFYKQWRVMSERAGRAHPPQLILVEHPATYAAAIGRDEVVITTGLLATHTPEQVYGVLAHELAHTVSEHTKSDRRAAIIGGGIGALIGNYVAYQGGIIGKHFNHDVKDASWLRQATSRFFGRGDKPLSLLSSAAMIVAGTSVGVWISNYFGARPNEYDADAKGAEIAGSVDGLIGVLAHQEAAMAQRRTNPLMRFLSDLISDHPSHASRIARLKALAPSLPPVTEPPLTALNTAEPELRHEASTPSARVNAAESALERVASAPLSSPSM